MVQRDQWDTYWGPKKLIFSIRDTDGPAMTAASMESCRICGPEVSQGSLLVGSRRAQAPTARAPPLHQSIHIRQGAQPTNQLEPQTLKVRSEQLKHRRMRRRGPPDPRPIPEGVREPIFPRKKCTIWTRWRPVPVKNVKYPRPPKNRNSGLDGPHTTPAIVNYKYMTSTLQEGYFGPTTLGT